MGPYRPCSTLSWKYPPLGIAIAAGFDQSCVLDSLDIVLALPWYVSSANEFVGAGWSYTWRRPSNRQEQPGEATWRHAYRSTSSRRATIIIGRPADSVDRGAQPALLLGRSGLETGRAVTASIIFPLTARISSGLWRAPDRQKRCR